MAFSVKLDPELQNRVQQLATTRQRSADWIMREAVQQYVEREEAAEDFKEEALAAWTEYQSTGRHLTGDEVRAWLDTWGTDTETDAPECHA